MVVIGVGDEQKRRRKRDDALSVCEAIENRGRMTDMEVGEPGMEMGLASRCSRSIWLVLLAADLCC